MASVPVYCLCRLPYDVTRFMIECDGCQDWFHGSCVGVEEEAAAEIDLYHCPKCEVLHGPSVMKRRRGPPKPPEVEPGRPVRTGSAQFVRELRGRTFPSADEVLLRPSGAQLTVEYLEEKTFKHYVGAEKIIDVIDVGRQADCRMRLGDFVAYLGGARRDRVLNVISLEFSDTRLSNLVETPRIVRKLSWVENLWPGESACERPSVQKYCLMGARDSYTDFHIDFGGTSVWYHVLRGEKIFYLVRPTAANLALFEAWSIDRCYRCPLRQGQTLFIPTGWIHAVLTPVDCLAFGGNFLHSLNIDMQLKAYEIERRLSTADLFKFPNFETVCWYVGRHLLDTFRGLRENRRHPAAYLVHGAKALTAAFRAWTRKEVLGEHEHEIPETVRPGQLIKELAKEIRLVEVGLLGGTGGYWEGLGVPTARTKPAWTNKTVWGACFKDAEYIYPSLESDEDDPALKSLPKKKKVTDDAPWSPKARVTPTLPRQSRPVREGTRVASVETGLAAAAAKLAQQVRFGGAGVRGGILGCKGVVGGGGGSGWGYGRGLGCGGTAKRGFGGGLGGVMEVGGAFRGFRGGVGGI
uniref:PHD finger protein 8 n=1 Tax=Aquila chrysaetos chrysaetos TaxID=223781 RepID=A0A663ESB0_AQUCH